MRSLKKLDEPQALIDNRQHWEVQVRLVGSDYFKTRYREQSIKQHLLSETHNKCAYCESKVGHNCPGDVEHKFPVSKDETGRFRWANLTVACTECNRRKNAYLDLDKPFADPYSHDVDRLFRHIGPCVFAAIGNTIGEITTKILEYNSRNELIGRKVTVLTAVSHLMERIAAMPSGPLQDVLIGELRGMAEPSKEYSAMVQSVLDTTDGPWQEMLPR